MTKPKLGDYFYYPDESYKNYGGRSSRYKINYITKEVFEFGSIYKGRFGWGFIYQLQVNPDKKSKVKWIFKPE